MPMSFTETSTTVNWFSVEQAMENAIHNEKKPSANILSREDPITESQWYVPHTKAADISVLQHTALHC
jgi:hypothetical protein